MEDHILMTDGSDYQKYTDVKLTRDKYNQRYLFTRIAALCFCNIQIGFVYSMLNFSTDTLSYLY